VVVDLAVAQQLEQPLALVASLIARRSPTPTTLSSGTSTVVSVPIMRRW
jgi:hypothetical protein